MATTVTIDKAYFETLLRRAAFHTPSDDLDSPASSPTVTISRCDYDNLLRIAREYTVLKETLISGGVEPESLEILIHGDCSSQPKKDYQNDDHVAKTGGEVVFERPQGRPVRITAPSPTSGISVPSRDLPASARYGTAIWREKNEAWGRQHSFSHDGNSFQSDLEKEEKRPVLTTGKQFYARNDQRTVMIKNLLERTTHKDVEDVIRGGAVLDIYLRSHEKSASVSFVEGSAAQAFITFAKRNGIYIHGKRAEVQWNDRQFILPSHVAGKIHGGATRNLIIRGVQPNITGNRIRDDLDHIHNLVVVDIVFQQGDAIISLNSVHNSLFARSCMMSRSSYKGMKIEWYQDKCAAPLPQMQYASKKEHLVLPAKKLNPAVNRFQMLNIGTENSSETEEDDLGNFSPVQQGTALRSTTVVT